MFEVSAVSDMEMESAHSKLLLKSADHLKRLLNTLQTNMQTLNRLLDLPWTNVAAVWKHTETVDDPLEREVKDAFSFDFSVCSRQAALKYPFCSAVSTQRLIIFPVRKCLETFLTIKPMAFIHFVHCNICDFITFFAILLY